VDAGDLLRRLDRWLLPPLARGLERLNRHPMRLQVLAGAALVSATTVLIAAVWAADRPVGDPTVGNVVRVGVGEGESIPSYVRASRGELAALLATPPTAAPGGQTYALVTLAAYVAPGRLAPVLGGVSVSEVFARVPLPDTQTEIVRIVAFRVPDDVTAAMEMIAQRKEREALDYRQLSQKLSGGDEERQRRAVYDSGARVAAAEATAYRSHCSCLYAAVVRGAPEALDRIAARPEVRAVDPAPEVRRLDRAVFLPPLPEQSDVAHPPADGALPSPAPALSGGSPSPLIASVAPGEPGAPLPPTPSRSADPGGSPEPTGTPAGGAGTATATP
jgi:hypothetical protein